MAVGLLLLLLATAAGGDTDYSGRRIVGQPTSARLQHWTTVSGVLGVTLLLLGVVIATLGRHRRNR